MMTNRFCLMFNLEALVKPKPNIDLNQLNIIYIHISFLGLNIQWFVF